ncbi:hypothetical protein CF392_14325 [Tamilnaduibacter salinus]|uniref:Uncharacterized protein n=1 Tax=Tamilnaduibacter salinus TaxID=1484056 RepID=A0A2A2I0E4_9GAMM|nr:hypothetical protein [Tamilnaduibacter salinus]PAV24776.1 hypothetical protein CF392_14325 [Tamilnaduibacter salinus]
MAVYTDHVHQYASLISRDAFARLAGQYADTLDPDAPPINVAGLTPTHNAFGVASYQPAQPVSIPLIAQAHAADGESSFVWDLVNWFVPVEDFGFVLDQLGYLVSDPEKFDGMEFTIALVNTITIFPPAKPLKLFTKPLRAMFRKLDKVNPAFARHFAGYLGKVVQKAKRGDFDTLWNTLPFLVLAAELYNDPESREGLKFLFSTVDSADDVLSWVNYLGLPANGWEGEGDPPEVPAFGDEIKTSSVAPLGWLIPAAHANTKTGIIRRVTSKFLGGVLKRLATRVTGQEAKNIPDAIRIVRRQLGDVSAKDLRKYAFSSDMLKSSAWMMTHSGSRALRNFIRGKTNMRYKPITVMAIVAYLGWESGCGVALDQEAKSDPDSPEMPPDTEPSTSLSEQMKCDGKGLNQQVRRQIGIAMAKIFADSFDRKLSEVPGPVNRKTGHGQLFQMGETAFHQLKHRYAGGPPVKALERARWVGIFESQGQLDRVENTNFELKCPANCVRKIQRNVDIILGEEDGPEHWIELKSVKSKAEKKSENKSEKRYQLSYPGTALKRWNLKPNQKSDATMHKQFSVDVAATNTQFAWLPKSQTGVNIYVQKVPIDKADWRFQAFKVDKKSPKIYEISPLLGKRSKKQSLRDLFGEGPEAKSEKEKDVALITYRWPSGVERRAELVTVTRLISELATSKVSDLVNREKPQPDLPSTD